jgi:hypothetical protein
MRLAQVLYGYNVNGEVHSFKSPNHADAVKMCFAPASLGVEIIRIF